MYNIERAVRSMALKKTTIGKSAAAAICISFINKSGFKCGYCA
jgi:hypothetical protein